MIEETLSPTWDELMVFDEVLVYGRREDIKANPPSIIIETYDQDKVRLGDNYKYNNFSSGRKSRVPWQSYWEATCLPGGGSKLEGNSFFYFSLLKVDYCPPKLEWFQIYRGNEEAGKVCLIFKEI